jgi:hypothetical protein
MKKSILSLAVAGATLASASMMFSANPAQAFDLVYSIDLKNGIYTTPPAPFISYVSLPTLGANGYYETVLKINLNDPAISNPYNKATFSITYDKNPSGFTLDIGDSITDNAGGGDSATQSNDSEVWIEEDVYKIASNDYNDRYNPNNPYPYYTVINNFVPQGGGNITLGVANEFTSWNNNNGVSGSLSSPYIFALNGQADNEGPINYDVFAAFNRVVDGNYRNGEGLSAVTIHLSTVPEPLTILGSGIALGFGGFLKRKLGKYQKD